MQFGNINFINNPIYIYNYNDLTIWKINEYSSLRILKQLTKCANLFFKKFQIEWDLIVMYYMWAEKKKLAKRSFLSDKFF